MPWLSNGLTKKDLDEALTTALNPICERLDKLESRMDTLEKTVSHFDKKLDTLIKQGVGSANY